MIRIPARFSASPRAPTSPSSRRTPPRLYRLDGGYIVLGAAASRGGEAFASTAAAWRGHHVIAIAGAPDAATEGDLAELGRAAQAFGRVVVCPSGGFATAASTEAAARFVRAVRAAGRTECHFVADAHRALRHCIDGMRPGDVVAYCCEDAGSAARILAEYGALPVSYEAAQRGDAATGTHVALNDPNGELTAAHG